MKRFNMMLLPMLAMCAGTAAAATVTVSGVAVRAVSSLPDGGFIMFGPNNIDAACDAGGAFYVRANQNGQTPEGVKVSLSLVLTALSTGHTLSVVYDNSSSYCYASRFQIDP